MNEENATIFTISTNVLTQNTLTENDEEYVFFNLETKLRIFNAFFIQVAYEQWRKYQNVCIFLLYKCDFSVTVT